MEQTTLQQRIEERAKEKLLKDMLKAANQEFEIENLFGSENYKRQLSVRVVYSQYSTPREKIKIENNYSEELFDKMLPKYITSTTDEILSKIDDIDNLLANNKETYQEEY